MEDSDCEDSRRGYARRGQLIWSLDLYQIGRTGDTYSGGVGVVR